MVPFAGETGSDSALTAGLRKKAEASKVIRPGMNNPKNRANDFSIEEYTYLQESEPLDRQVPYLPDLQTAQIPLSILPELLLGTIYLNRKTLRF